MQKTTFVKALILTSLLTGHLIGTGIKISHVMLAIRDANKATLEKEEKLASLQAELLSRINHNRNYIRFNRSFGKNNLIELIRELGHTHRLFIPSNLFSNKALQEEPRQQSLTHECMICHHQPKHTLFLTCNHIACKPCLLKFFAFNDTKNQSNLCPMCRQEIDKEIQNSLREDDRYYFFCIDARRSHQADRDTDEEASMQIAFLLQEEEFRAQEEAGAAYAHTLEGATYLAQETIEWAMNLNST